MSIRPVVRFLKLRRATGSINSAQFGGYKDFALVEHEDLVRQLVAEQPEITELGKRLAKKKIVATKSSISRFLHHLQLHLKKRLRAAEQDRPDIAAARRILRRRLVQKVLHGNSKTLSFIAALRHDGVTAPFVLEGAMNGGTFKAYIEPLASG